MYYTKLIILIAMYVHQPLLRLKVSRYCDICVLNLKCLVLYILLGRESLAGENFGEFGESSVICQTKTIQIFTYNYYLLAEFIHSPNFSSPNAHNSEFAKLFCRQTFPLYGIQFMPNDYY